MTELQRGITNFVWEREDGKIVKNFSKYRWNIILLNIFKFFFMDFRPQGLRDGIEREVEAKDKLSKIGVKVPLITEKEEDYIVMEKLEGSDLESFLENSKPYRCFEKGLEKGSQLRKIHDNNFSLTDSRLSNSFVVGDDLFSLDHELFEKKSSDIQKELDLISLQTSARFINKINYGSFIKGVKEGYGEGFRKNLWVRYFLTFFTGLWLGTCVKKSPEKTLINLKNWFRDIYNFI